MQREIFLLQVCLIIKPIEVLPLQLNYTFGRSQGIEKLDHDASFNFYRSPHQLKLFSTKDFSSLKKEKAFIVRTPDEVMQWFWIISVGFIAWFYFTAYYNEYLV